MLAALLLTVIPFAHVSEPIDRSDFNYSAIVNSKSTECSLDGVTYRTEMLDSQRVDAKLIVEGPSGRTERQIPVSRFKTDARTHAPVVCDAAAGRVFVGSSVVGSVSAFSAQGDHLWTLRLPGFSSANDDDGLSSDNPADLVDGLAERHSLLLTLHVVGDHVVAQYVTARSQFTQVIIHRSGVISATVGPWVGFLVAAEGNKITLVTDFEVQPQSRVYPERPRQRIVATVTSKESVAVRHFLAWLLPLSGDKAYGWRQCVAIPRSAIAGRLGSSYDAVVSRQMKTRHDELGNEWFVKLINRGQLPRVLGEAHPESEAWVERLQAELLRAGADVYVWRDAISEASGTEPMRGECPIVR